MSEIERDTFGDFFLPSDLIGNANALLQKWFPPYLAKLEKRTGLPAGSLKIPTNYSDRTSIDTIPGEALPKVIVLSPGVAHPPTKSGRGIYRGTWRLGVGVTIVGETELEAYVLSTLYGVAIRLIFVHHPSILGSVQNLNYVDESYDAIPTAAENQRYRGAAVWFEVDIDNVVQIARGPQDPAIGYGIAEKVEVQVDKI